MTSKASKETAMVLKNSAETFTNWLNLQSQNR